MSRMYSSFSFSYQSSKITAITKGDAKRLLVALHGFGESSRAFLPILDFYAEQYKVIAIDLPAHGSTNWQAARFTLQDFIDILQQLMDTEKIEKVNLIGHSFGARLAMRIAVEQPAWLDKLYLLAPDGISTKGLSTILKYGRRIDTIITGLLNRPKLLFRLAKTLHLIRLIPSSSLAFLSNQMSNEQKRSRILLYWQTLWDLHIDKKRFAQLIDRYTIALEVYVGTDDKIVDKVMIQQFLTTIPSAKYVEVPKAGHRIMGDQLMKLILQE